MIGTAPNCLKCIKYHSNDYEQFSCDQYPEGIPEEIVDNQKKCEYEELEK